MRITIYPQVVDERIEFGRPDEVDTKLKKLMIFYKEDLVADGLEYIRKS
jgi:cell division protein FtsQ